MDRSKRDIILVLAISLVVYLIGAHFDLVEVFLELAEPYENYELDEIPLAGMILAVGASWYALRRRKEALSRAKELELANSELQNEVSRRLIIERAMRDAKEEADRANQAKSSFLAVMSHELRTPLNGVLGMMELLGRTDLTVRQERFVEGARTSGEMLLVLINDVLDLAKIEADRLILDEVPFDIYELINDIASVFTGMTSEKGLSLTCVVESGVPSPVVGDPARLRQVLTNLVGNAVKFTEKGRVAMRVGLEERKKDHVFLRFEVEDTGIGIDEADQARVFEGFVQVERTAARKHGGTGLGLAISRRLANLMGGRIGLRSELGSGATFWFTARLGVSEDANGGRRTGVHGARLLVVDADQDSRNAIQEQIRAWGVRGEVAPNGMAVVERLELAAGEDDPFDLVMIDEQLDGPTALELVRTIKSHDALAELPIVLIVPAGHLRSDDIGQLANVLSRPVLPSPLYDCLVRTLRGERVSAADKERLAAQPESLDAPSLLLAEDNELNQEVATEMLRLTGCRVDVVDTGQAAVDQLENHTYDAVLMDCQMPVMDGYAATRLIREREAETGRPRVPIIALTANALAGEADKCHEAGMDDYVSKPVTLDRLKSVLNVWLPKGLGPASGRGGTAVNP